MADTEADDFVAGSEPDEDLHGSASPLPLHGLNMWVAINVSIMARKSNKRKSLIKKYETISRRTFRIYTENFK